MFSGSISLFGLRFVLFCWVLLGVLGASVATAEDFPLRDKSSPIDGTSRESFYQGDGLYQKRPWLGVMVDAGVPDGVNIAAVWRPYYWLRVHGGGAHNSVGFGLRAGASVLPLDFWVTPSLVIEGGHFFRTRIDTFLAGITGIDEGELPQEISYSYGNLHLGAEFILDRVTIYLRGGYSLISANIGAPLVVDDVDLRVEGDSHATIFSPSAKLGFIIYLI